MPASKPEERVLIIAPVGQDAVAMESLLKECGFEAEVCADPNDAVGAMATEAGLLLLTEEAFELPGTTELLEALDDQPAWSELPLIVLTRGGESRLAKVLDLASARAGTVTLLERPLGRATLSRTVDFALHFRRRQYHVRDLLEEQRRKQEQLAENERRLAADYESLSRLHQTSSRLVSQTSFQTVMEEILETAIWLTHADKGNIQLYDPAQGTLAIVVARGFPEACLAFFERVGEGHVSACANAMSSGERIIVEDVATHPIFVGTPALQVQLSAGVRAVQSTPLFNRDGAFMGVISTHFSAPHRPEERDLYWLDLLARQAADLLERKRTEDNLERLVADRTADLRTTNEQLETFVYSIAHDLRAPLRSMSGYSQMLLEDYAAALDPTARQLLDRIHGSSEFMDKLLLDLLAYGRAMRAEMPLEPVPVQKAWETALFQCSAQIERTQARVVTEEPLPMVLAHEATLGQCLANLLSNALKFVASDVRPEVRCRAEDHGDNARLWIEDNGLGIQAEYHERIFRAFERLHGARYLGTGVGLSIVRKGIERMGGAVGVESQPNQGSRFWIELPKPTSFTRSIS